jgi:predicted GNAT family acetyltransferase
VSDPIDVRHNESAHRFEAQVEGGTAYCAYERRDDTLHLYHTEVPREAEGRGVAGAVVKAAMDHAAQHGLRVAPACSYVRSYMQRHPETHALLAAGAAL